MTQPRCSCADVLPKLQQLAPANVSLLSRVASASAPERNGDVAWCAALSCHKCRARWRSKRRPVGACCRGAWLYQLDPMNSARTSSDERVQAIRARHETLRAVAAARKARIWEAACSRAQTEPSATAQSKHNTEEPLCTARLQSAGTKSGVAVTSGARRSKGLGALRFHCVVNDRPRAAARSMCRAHAARPAPTPHPSTAKRHAVTAQSL